MLIDNFNNFKSLLNDLYTALIDISPDKDPNYMNNTYFTHGMELQTNHKNGDSHEINDIPFVFINNKYNQPYWNDYNKEEYVWVKDWRSIDKPKKGYVGVDTLYPLVAFNKKLHIKHIKKGVFETVSPDEFQNWWFARLPAIADGIIQIEIKYTNNSNIEKIIMDIYTLAGLIMKNIKFLQEHYPFFNDYNVSSPSDFIEYVKVIQETYELRPSAPKIKEMLESHTKPSAFQQTGGRVKLETLTVKELQQRCIKRKIKYAGLRKAELVAALRRR
jgi:hypothetical protein